MCVFARIIKVASVLAFFLAQAKGSPSSIHSRFSNIIQLNTGMYPTYTPTDEPIKTALRETGYIYIRNIQRPSRKKKNPLTLDQLAKDKKDVLKQDHFVLKVQNEGPFLGPNIPIHYNGKNILVTFLCNTNKELKYLQKKARLFKENDLERIRKTKEYLYSLLSTIIYDTILQIKPYPAPISPISISAIEKKVSNLNISSMIEDTTEKAQEIKSIIEIDRNTYSIMPIKRTTRESFLEEVSWLKKIDSSLLQREPSIEFLIERIEEYNFPQREEVPHRYPYDIMGSIYELIDIIEEIEGLVSIITKKYDEVWINPFTAQYRSQDRFREGECIELNYLEIGSKISKDVEVSYATQNKIVEARTIKDIKKIQEGFNFIERNFEYADGYNPLEIVV